MEAVLGALRDKLAALDDLRARVVDAIAALERLTGVGPRVVFDQVHMQAPDASAAPIVDELHAAAPPSTRKTDHTRRPMKEAEDDAARVLALLTRLGKLSLKAIAEGTDLPRARAKYILTRLRGDGKVIAEGETAQRVFYVKGLRVSKPVDNLEPIWNGATKQSPADVLQQRREARA